MGSLGLHERAEGGSRSSTVALVGQFVVLMSGRRSLPRDIWRLAHIGRSFLLWLLGEASHECPVSWCIGLSDLSRDVM